MEDKGKRKQEIFIQIIIGICVTILDEILEKIFEGIFKNKMPIILFYIVMFCMIGILVFVCNTFISEFLRNMQRYKRNLDKLMNNARTDIEVRQEYGYRKDQIEKRYKEKCHELFKEVVKRIVLALVFMVVVCAINPNNARACWDDITMLGRSETTETDNKTEEQETPQELPEEPEQKTERNTTWRFVLDEVGEPVEDYGERLQQVFFEGENDILSTVQGWRTEKRKGVNHITVKDKEGNTFYTYTELEDSFTADVNSSAAHVYYEEWVKYAPHSSRLDQYIKGRETLNKVEMSGEKGCYDIWWKLANDYQYYAQEYERQTEDAEAILYYYANSIYCCMESLKYVIDDGTYNATYHYMVTRYKDIARYECLIDGRYKAQAQAIYDVLVTKDVLSKENM